MWIFAFHTEKFINLSEISTINLSSRDLILRLALCYNRDHVFSLPVRSFNDISPTETMMDGCFLCFSSASHVQVWQDDQ